MPSFRVATEALTAARVLVGASDADLVAGHSAVGGSAGACAGRPADLGFAALLGAVDTVVPTVRGAVSGLEFALQQAAVTYQLSDSTAATALSVKRG